MLARASRRRLVVATLLVVAALSLLLVGGAEPLVFADPTFYSWYWSTGLMWVPPLTLATSAAVGLHLTSNEPRKSIVSALQALAIGSASIILAVPVCIAVWVAELALLYR